MCTISIPLLINYICFPTDGHNIPCIDCLKINKILLLYVIIRLFKKIIPINKLYRKRTVWTNRTSPLPLYKYEYSLHSSFETQEFLVSYSMNSRPITHPLKLNGISFSSYINDIQSIHLTKARESVRQISMSDFQLNSWAKICVLYSCYQCHQQHKNVRYIRPFL